MDIGSFIVFKIYLQSFCFIVSISCGFSAIEVNSLVDSSKHVQRFQRKLNIC